LAADILILIQLSPWSGGFPGEIQQKAVIALLSLPARPIPDKRRPNCKFAARIPGPPKWDSGLTDIFSEVGEDIRNARLKSLWDRYGVLVIGAAVALVVGVAVTVYWQNAERKQSQTAATELFAGERMLAEGKTAEAVEHFSKLSETSESKGYLLLLQMKQAAAKTEAGDTAGAVAIYDAMAADGRFESVMRDLASLKAAMLLADSISPDELKLRLAPLAKPENPWRHSAREMLAFLALRQGDVEAARMGFQELADDLASSQGVRARAAEILQALPASAAVPVTK